MEVFTLVHAETVTPFFDVSSVTNIDDVRIYNRALSACLVTISILYQPIEKPKEVFQIRFQLGMFPQ